MPKTGELVVNTGPLLALIAGIGNLSILEPLYKRILVPYEVCREIEAGGSSGFGVTEFNNAGFIEKRNQSTKVSSFLQNVLDIGEASVIQLALDENVSTVCIDEEMGRRIARLNGLNLTGSIGVLIRAKREGLDFSMQETINRMQSHGIYLSRKVISFALHQSEKR
jgi:predicted nucleic acid-binding protein